MKLATAALALAWLSACGSSEKQESADAAQTIEVDAAISACAREGFEATSEKAERDDELGVLFYTGSRGTAPQIEMISVDFYFSLGASDQAHDLTLTGENLADCHTCVLLRSGCDVGGCANGRAFLAQSGALSVTDVGMVGGRMVGSIADARFAEVTISAGDLRTTLVPDGDIWCLESFAFDLPIAGLP